MTEQAPQSAGESVGPDRDAEHLVRRAQFRPTVDPDNEAFWKGTREAALVVQSCDNCGTLRYPPAPACSQCRSLEWSPSVTALEGVVHAVVKVHRPGSPFQDPNGYLLALVDVAPGVRLATNVVESTLEEVSIGSRVEVCFTPLADGYQIHQARLLR